jgi:hypothetical protein
MSLIGPFAKAEVEYRRSRLVEHEIESHRRRRPARRAPKSHSHRAFRWHAIGPTTTSPA